MLEYQRITGINLLEGFKCEGIEQCAAMTYACFLHEDKELTYDDVLLLLDIDNMAEVFSAVRQCFSDSIPAPKEKAEKPPLVTKPQAG